MTHDPGRRIQSEFERQARQMASAPAFRTAAVLERFVRAVGELPSGRVLDVACGPGIVAEAVAPQVGAVVGIDATRKMIRLARERLRAAHYSNGRFMVAAAEQLPFENGLFEHVLTRLSFHHFQDVSPALNEMRRVLRAGGRLTVADIISADDAEQASLHNSLEQLRDPTHVRFLAGAELVERIEAAGFSVITRESWPQERAFDEWAAIIADPVRTQPLERVMLALASGGQACGMALREEQGRVLFTHTWLMVSARLV